MCKRLLILLLLSAVLTGCDRQETLSVTASLAAPPEKPLPTDRIAERVADRMPRIHLNHHPFDDTIATNALMLFVNSLDYDHSFFLASDITEFQQQATNLDNQVEAGNVSFSQTVFDRFKERVTNRVAYADTLLDKGFDLDKNETWQWKRDKAPWAANQKEWDDLWRKKLKNEYVSRLAAIEADREDQEQQTGTNTVAEAEGTNTIAEIDESLTPTEFVRERYKQYQLLIDINDDRETILERYLSAFTHSYDPHSDYLSPRSVEDFDINMRLSLVGIGAILRSEDGAAKITQLIAGGPAEVDGRLQPGDKIIAVTQGDNAPEVSILYWPLSKAVRLIRGEKGTKVILTVIPAEDTTGTRTRKIDLIRDEVKLEAQAAKGEIKELQDAGGKLHHLGVLTLPEFYADFEAARKGDTEARRASTDVRRILEEFSTNRVDGVVLDLRNDGGGSLTEAIDIAGLFIPLGPIVQVREQRGVAVLPDGDPETLYRGPLVVLVNRLSASASEIVAAALQDYDRAVIVGGSKTHGKGTVQTVFPLSKLSSDLGSLKVTTAGFYRITGGSTQLLGVAPDVVLPSLYDTLEIGEEFLPNALPWSQIRSAYYRPWYQSVKPFIPELRKRSKMRIKNTPEFKNFLARRDRIRQRMETPDVSLKLSDRIADILSEKELDTIQDEMIGVDGDGDKDKKKEDPILDETLNILSDLVNLTEGETVITKTD
ncbi:MAG: carboxyl-terminal processing protease [Verrucomicrobiota bacterium]|jgi:carboxyl-terminal processing protease|nr:carboxyl-terminal processing protease [Verrucomicrobiota bacterium]